MKVKELKRALGFLKKFLPKKYTIPHIEYVYLGFHGGVCKIEYTNIVTTIQMEIECNNDLDFSTFVQLSDLYSIVKVVYTDEIGFEFDQEKDLLAVTFGKSQAVFMTPRKDEIFPPFLKRPDDMRKVFVMEGKHFRQVFTRISPAASRDSAHPILTNAIFEKHFIGCADGFILARYNIELPEHGFQIPVRVIKKLASYMSHNSEIPLTLWVNEDIALFEYKGFRVYTEMVRNTTPNLDRVCQHNEKTHITINVDAQTMYNIFRVMQKAGSASRLIFSENTLEVKAVSYSSFSVLSSIPYRSEDKYFEKVIRIIPDFFCDLFRHISDGSFDIHIRSDDVKVAPIHIEYGNFEYAIMPLYSGEDCCG